MYRDAKEELKRLEAALLEESEEAFDGEETGEDDESREEYTEAKKPAAGRRKMLFILALELLAVLIFWFVRYGRDLL